MTHPEIRKIKSKEAILELTESQKNIKRIFGNQYGDFLAYPYGDIPCEKNVIDVLKKTYKCARTTKPGFVGKGSYLYELPTISVTHPRLNKKVEKSIKNNNIIIVYGHGIKDIGGSDPIKLKEFKEHVRFLHKNRDDIWFTTFPKLFDYLVKQNRIKGDNIC